MSGTIAKLHFTPTARSRRSTRSSRTRPARPRCCGSARGSERKSPTRSGARAAPGVGAAASTRTASAAPRRRSGGRRLFKPAVGVHRQFAVQVERAGQDLLPAEPRSAKPEILHQDQLGRREAVVHLGHCELCPRIGRPRPAGRRPAAEGRPRGRSCSRTRDRCCRRPGPATNSAP